MIDSGKIVSMVDGRNHGHPSPNRSLAGLRRDAALIRVSRTRRALFVGAVGLSAGLAALVSAIAPGRSLAAKSPLRTAASDSTLTVASAGASTTSASAARRGAPRMPPLASPGELGLQAPDAAPQAPSPSPDQSAGSSGSGATAQPAAPAQSQAAPAPQPAPPASSGGVVSGGS
jgi:hypothetical protein